jgi:hypothetical protein
MKKLHLGSGALALMLGACAEAPKSDDFGYNGTGIAVSVAPLTLESLSDACYSFTVVNNGGDLVVGRGPGAIQAGWGAEVTGTAADTVCASQFGNGDGGDVSYVAPCDADTGMENHTVTLWVDALCDSTFAGPLVKNGAANWSQPSPNNSSGICTEIQPYQNPCGSQGCTLPVTCEENADTPVTFNFTIMGQADQGFFDIAVNFDDVFCSAKMDDCNTEDQPIQLVFDTTETVLAPGGCPWGTGLAYQNLSPAENTFDGTGPNPDGCYLAGGQYFIAAGNDTPEVPAGPVIDNPNLGKRIDTLVAAVACTAGPGNDVFTHLTFTDVVVRCVNPFFQTATLTLTDVAQEGNLMIGPFPASITFGTESLSGVNKVFTTISVGIGDRTGCGINFQVLPSDGPHDFGEPDEYNSFGYVNFEGNAYGEGCNQDGLTDGGQWVTTMYHPNTPLQPTSFNSQLPEGGETFSTWASSCVNSAASIETLLQLTISAEATAANLLTDVTDDCSAAELEAELVSFRGQVDFLEALLAEYQACDGEETALAALAARIAALRSTAITIELILEGCPP